MAEINAVYTVAGMTMNATTGDTAIIETLVGLDDAPYRMTIEDAPMTDGGVVVGEAKDGPRQITIEGYILIRSAALDPAIATARNALIDAWIAALNTIRTPTGTLAWTPTGGSAKSLTVMKSAPFLTGTHRLGPMVKSFVFGLTAPDPTIT